MSPTILFLKPVNDALILVRFADFLDPVLDDAGFSPGFAGNQAHGSSLEGHFISQVLPMHGHANVQGNSACAARPVPRRNYLQTIQLRLSQG